MTQQIHHRHITDTRTVLSVTLKQRNASRVLTVVDLTGPLTVKFKMVDSEGTVVIEETVSGVTIDSETEGQVSYDFSSSSVTTGGTYYGYFIVYNGSNEGDHFPVEHRALKIILSAD
jgi:hypothetical protein